MGPSWLQLGSSWAHVGPISGSPAALGPTQALPNPFPVASGPPKTQVVPYKTQHTMRAGTALLADLACRPCCPLYIIKYTCASIHIYALFLEQFNSRVDHLDTVHLSTDSQAAVPACSSSNGLIITIMPSCPSAQPQRVRSQRLSNCKR